MIFERDQISWLVLRCSTHEVFDTLSHACDIDSVHLIPKIDHNGFWYLPVPKTVVIHQSLLKKLLKICVKGIEQHHQFKPGTRQFQKLVGRLTCIGMYILACANCENAKREDHKITDYNPASFLRHANYFNVYYKFNPFEYLETELGVVKERTESVEKRYQKRKKKMTRIRIKS